jgi:hypothetical protein
MEDQQEDFDALLAHLTEKLEMKDVEPYELASMAAIEMYKEFTQNGIKEQIDTTIRFAQMSLHYAHNNPKITGRLQDYLRTFLESWYERTGDMTNLEEAV